MALRDHSVLDAVARDERQDPLPQKTFQDRTIYLSRNDFGFQVHNLGRPVITDFGLSVHGNKPRHNHTIQPNGFRAPEVIIGAGWDYSADMWNLGALVRPNRFSSHPRYSNILTRSGSCYVGPDLLILPRHLRIPLLPRRNI